MASISSSAQRTRVLNALAHTLGGLTTIELREQHDVMMPAARVHELRNRYDKKIITIYATATNAQGNQHRVARYVLLTDSVEK